MKKIFEHIEYARVGHYQSILESAGLRVHVKNLCASIATGELPFTQMYPELWVVDDSDYQRALDILRPYHLHEFPIGADWRCPECGEEVAGTFEECWNCQSPRPLEHSACPKCANQAGGTPPEADQQQPAATTRLPSQSR